MKSALGKKKSRESGLIEREPMSKPEPLVVVLSSEME